MAPVTESGDRVTILATVRATLRNPRSLVSSPARQVSIAVAFNQVIVVALLPLIALLYRISDIGRYQVVLSLAITLQILATCGIEYTLPGIASDEFARRFYRRGVKLLLLLTGLAVIASAGVGIFAGASQLELWLGTALLVFSYGSFALDNARLLRSGRQRVLVHRNVISGVVTVLVQALGGIAFSSFWVLIGGMVLGRAAALLVRDRESGTTRVDVRAPSDLDKRATSLGQSAAWVLGILLSNAALQLPIVAAGALIGSPREAALLALAVRVVSAPASLLGGGASQGFVFTVSRRMRENASDLQEYVARAQRRLTWTSMAVGIGLLILGPLAVVVLFSRAWVGAAWMIAVLAIPYALQLVNRVTTPLFTLFGMSGRLLAIQALRCAVIIAGIAIVEQLDLGVWGLVVAVGATALLFQAAFLMLTTSSTRQWSDERAVA